MTSWVAVQSLIHTGPVWPGQVNAARVAGLGLPEGDLAWFLLDAVAQMDLAKIERTYQADGWGRAAYEPAMMVALLLYAFCLGERSSQRIERLCERDLAFRVITANQCPDHTTRARFRQTHEAELATQFSRLCGSVRTRAG